MFKLSSHKFIIDAIFIVLIGLVIGCNSRDDTNVIASKEITQITDELTNADELITPQIKLGNFTISVENYHKIDTNILEVTLSYIYDDVVFRRILLLERYISISKEIEIVAKMLDTDYRLCWEYRLGFNPDKINEFTIIEKTPEDELIIDVKANRPTVEEKYHLNGKDFTITYDNNSLNSYKHSALNNTSLKLYDNHKFEYYRLKHQEFTDFYMQNSTLDNNIDGTVTMNLIGSKEFFTMIGYNQHDSFDEMDPTVKEICKWSERSLIKCGWGGFLNPLCIVSIGTTAACWGVEIYYYFAE